MKIQSHHDLPRYAWLTPASSDPRVHAMRITTSTGTVDLTRAEFEQLATLLAEDVRARAHEEVQLQLREPRRRPRRVRLRLALATVCAVLAMPLTACGTGGPSMEAAASSSSARPTQPEPKPIVPDGFKPIEPPREVVTCVAQGYLNRYADAVGREASYLAIREMLRATQTRTWAERTEDENEGFGGYCALVGRVGFACIPAELATVAMDAPRGIRPRMAAEIEAATYFRPSRIRGGGRDEWPDGGFSPSELCVSQNQYNEPWLPDSRAARIERTTR
ncbi:hypothetical protein TPB0596_42150 [Tsukamurella pulmonis]|uniref:hypothetical protein n=1 Tax=Tsukamurella pulmonis TaxID=47312 RepID=UPI001EDD57EA|nr:hypothetical protein [Tsukamurella pulmonis]BDD84452.1 hypothetical protein TPB0596_42150 [Tsukamurella pulmonis]